MCTSEHCAAGIALAAPLLLALERGRKRSGRVGAAGTRRSGQEPGVRHPGARLACEQTCCGERGTAQFGDDRLLPYQVIPNGHRISPPRMSSTRLAGWAESGTTTGRPSSSSVSERSTAPVFPAASAFPAACVLVAALACLAALAARRAWRPAPLRSSARLVNRGNRRVLAASTEDGAWASSGGGGPLPSTLATGLSARVARRLAGCRAVAVVGRSDSILSLM